MLPLLAAALLLLGAVPLAEDPRFAEARQLYTQLEFERATLLFQELALAEDRPAAERAAVLVWVAMGHAQLANFTAAERALEEAVRLDARVELPPDPPPRVKEMLDRARASRPAPPPTTAPSEEAPKPAAPAAGAPAAADGTDPLFVGGLVTAGVGAVALLGAGGLAVGGLLFVQVADDPTTVQRRVQEAAASANGLFVAAAVTGGVGALLLAGGAALAVMDLE